MPPDQRIAERADRARPAAELALSARSPLVVATFSRIFTRALKKDFHAVRVSRASPPPAADTPRLILYSNHPSWWDAMIYLVVGTRFFPGRAGYAPIDARMLESYGFMNRIGAVGIAQGSARGASAFLATGRLVLENNAGLFCVSAQGRFTDARVRPLRLAAGLAHLAALAPKATLAPLAIDYTFWDERKPELLLRFGEPVAATGLAEMDAEARTHFLAQRLQTTMDELAREAISRRPEAFETIISGSVGVGGFYDFWRRSRAFLRGQSFSPAHGDER